MIVYEYKLYGKQEQFDSIKEAIRTTQFIRNKALRTWIDSKNNEQKENATTLYRLSKTLKDDESFPWVRKLNSSARQAATERAWTAISRFFKKTSKFPKFQKDNRSVEFKKSGWKLSDDYKKITIKSCNIGTLKMKGTRDLTLYNTTKINRVRLLKRADGYYVQFCINANRKMKHEYKGKAVGLDVGLNHFYTDSNGNKIENPRFLRKAEKRIKRLHRIFSKTKKKSSNRNKARKRLGKAYLKISRQRKDFAVKTARQVIVNNDFVAIEDLKVKNMVKNHCLAKSISDVSWRLFRNWLEYYGTISEVKVVSVPPQYTSQKCSNCGIIVKKSLSQRTHICKCGLILDRDENAAINILALGYKELNTAGHVEINASGDFTSTLLSKTEGQVRSLKEESTRIYSQ